MDRTKLKFTKILYGYDELSMSIEAQNETSAFVERQIRKRGTTKFPKRSDSMLISLNKSNSHKTTSEVKKHVRGSWRFSVTVYAYKL
jgi:hypothetical protein